MFRPQLREQLDASINESVALLEKWHGKDDGPHSLLLCAEVCH